MLLKTTLVKLLTISLTLCITIGCTNTAKLGGVNISIKEITPAAEANTLQLNLLYTNENVIPLAISITKHTLYLNGTKVSTLESKQAVGLPPLASATQTLNVPVTDAAALAALKNSTRSLYRLSSVLTVEAGEDDTFTIKTSSSGNVSLSAIKN